MTAAFQYLRPIPNGTEAFFVDTAERYLGIAIILNALDILMTSIPVSPSGL
jgi:hypothetical protein